MCGLWSVSLDSAHSLVESVVHTGPTATCQLKPLHNLRGLVKSAIFSSFCSLRRSSFSPLLSLFFFSNQVRFYRASSVSNHYQLWNFRRQSVWEPQYQLRSSRPASLQTRGRFLKRWEKLHKEHIWDRFKTNCQWKYFHTLLNLLFLFLSFLFLFTLHTKTVRQNWHITKWTYEIKKSFEWWPFFGMPLLRRYLEGLQDVIVVQVRIIYQLDPAQPSVHISEEQKLDDAKTRYWMMA